MQRVQATEFLQDGAERFMRNSGLPKGAFASDDAQSYPILPEAIIWVASFALMLLLFAAAMGADFTKILWLVAR